MDQNDAYRLEDHQAFEDLVMAHRQDAERFAYKILRDVHACEDIVQDSFVALYINRKKYKKKYSIKTYLYTIIRNKCIDHVRKQSRLIMTEDLMVTNEESPETLYLLKEKKTGLYKALDQIHKPYKLAIDLVDLEGLSYKEAAKIMDMSLSAFKVSLMRGRKQLKKQLEGVT